MKKLTIRLSDDLHEQVAALAKADQRSINKQVVWVIEQAVKKNTPQDKSQSSETKKSTDPI